MRMFVGGEWVDRPQTIAVTHPYDGSIVDTVPRATPEDVETALASAVRGASAMARLSGYDRFTILRKAADLIAERREDFARTISLEEGKTINEARAETDRAVQTITLSGEEAKRLHGETVPLDGAPGWSGQFGFTIRVPCGVVLAIAPFNFPLNLVAHKVGPALAAGNAVIVKPASDTPLSALKLTQALLDAGLPVEAIQCIVGSGKDVGDALVGDSRVRKVSFTGSLEVGAHIARVAGLKKVTMELGSSCPFVIMADADIGKAVQATISSGYGNAGQTCVSAQRIFAHRNLYTDYVDALSASVRALRLGDPLSEATSMGPMIRDADAARVQAWIHEAAEAGARVTVAPERDGARLTPAVVADARPDMRVSCDELFGPAVAVSVFNDVEEALTFANGTNFGLSAGIFTQNIDWAMQFAREAQFGNIMINAGPGWRADIMPFGGLKDSGLGKEGPSYAVLEMTELKMVAYHP